MTHPLVNFRHKKTSGACTQRHYRGLRCHYGTFMRELQENFKYDVNVIGKLERTLSKERLSPYLKQTKDNLEEALKLYTRNTLLSESFYPLIQGLEVCFRNCVHEHIKGEHELDWLISGKLQFQYIQEEQISQSLDKIRPKDHHNQIPKLIAELSFGFWTGILGKKYEELWRHHIRRVFQYSQVPLIRKQVHSEFEEIRKLRNRIAHHEPIFQRRVFTNR